MLLIRIHHLGDIQVLKRTETGSTTLNISVNIKIGSNNYDSKNTEDEK